MEVEFTARQVRITKALREQAEEGMNRVARIMGRSATASITFSAQKRQHIAEVTIVARLQTIAATGKADTLESALRVAIDHAENQARRHRDRRLEAKRLPKEEKVLTALPVARTKTRAAQTETATAKPTRASKAKKAGDQLHVVSSNESVVAKAMTIEEAVKHAEAEDRDLLVFRNPAGDLFVLHRRRDGKIGLIELP